MGRRADKQVGGHASEQDEVGDEKEKKAKREETTERGVISAIGGNNEIQQMKVRAL